jgi:hypothetical protein
MKAWKANPFVDNAENSKINITQRKRSYINLRADQRACIDCGCAGIGAATVELASLAANLAASSA